MRRLPRRWPSRAVLAAALVSGCARANDPARSVPNIPAPQGVQVYLPLYDGFVYQYDVESDSGETGRVMVEVTRPREGLAELSVAGRVQRLELSPDAIRHATGGVLLQSPLSVGARWKGQFGKVRVVSTNRSIQTPAGNFSGCLETVEEALAPVAKRAESVYCPKVGLVALHIEGALEGEAASVSTRLRSYGPRATGRE